MFYFQTGRCLEALDRFQRRRFKLHALKFGMIDDLLYKNVFDQTLLKCVTQDESYKILNEFHYGFSGGHYNGLTIATKVLQDGYYWPTIFQYSFKISQECDKCNKFMGKRRQAAMPLKPMVVEEPFQ